LNISFEYSRRPNFYSYVPHGPEERAIALLLQRLNRLLWQCRTSLLESLEAGVEVDKGEFETCGLWEGLENAAAGGDDFAANAVAGDEAW
jgi:hypothetical protein